jgi:hypothetical protein
MANDILQAAAIIDPYGGVKNEPMTYLPTMHQLMTTPYMLPMQPAPTPMGRRPPTRIDYDDNVLWSQPPNTEDYWSSTDMFAD